MATGDGIFGGNANRRNKKPNGCTLWSLRPGTRHPSLYATASFSALWSLRCDAIRSHCLSSRAAVVSSALWDLWSETIRARCSSLCAAAGCSILLTASAEPLRSIALFGFADILWDAVRQHVPGE